MTPSQPRRHARPAQPPRRSVFLWIAPLAGAAAVLAAAGTLFFSSSTSADPAGAASPSARASAGAIAPAGSSASDAIGIPDTSSAPPSPSSSPSSAPGRTPDTTGPFPFGLLIADRGNGRILAVNNAGHVVWKFPVKGSLPAGVPFAADDAFVSPDGKTIVANDEYHQVIYRIDIKTRKVIWRYGHFGVPGASDGYLHNPDDAYPLANGDIVVADIVNCRILQIAPDKHIVRTLGVTGSCADSAPRTYGDPNGDTPLPDGGLLITEIHGSRVVRLSPTGRVLFDFHLPVAYPSDAQIDSRGEVIVVDYSNPGSVVAMSQKGKLLWRWGPTSGPSRMDHPSLGTPLPNGDIVINDDARDRIIVVDPRSGRIVWQYGHTDRAGTAAGYLSDPDGHQPIPANALF